MVEKLSCEDANELKRRISVDYPTFAFYKSVDFLEKLSNCHHSTALRQAECDNYFGYSSVHNVALEVCHMLKCVDMRYTATTALERTELLPTLRPQ